MHLLSQRDEIVHILGERIHLRKRALHSASKDQCVLRGHKTRRELITKHLPFCFRKRATRSETFSAIALLQEQEEYDACVASSAQLSRETPVYKEALYVNRAKKDRRQLPAALHNYSFVQKPPSGSEKQFSELLRQGGTSHGNICPGGLPGRPRNFCCRISMHVPDHTSHESYHFMCCARNLWV